MALAFKPDSSFFRKIVIGAIGAQAVCRDLSQHEHAFVELERGSTDAKLWKEVKRKRVRMPDLVCKHCGIRVESRAKTKLELAMSHSPTEAVRAWDFGLVDSDWVAFPVVNSTDDEVFWSKGRISESSSYWHERNLVHWKTQKFVNIFSVKAFRAVKPDKEGKKGVTEGSEIVISWNASFAPCSGKIIAIDGRTVQIKPETGNTRSKRPSAKISVAVGETVEDGQVIASSVFPVRSGERKCAGKLAENYLQHALTSKERTLRYTGVKLARVLGDKKIQPFVEKLAPDPEEDLYVRLEALSYMAAVGGKPVLPLFEPHLNSGDDQIRLEAVISIGEVGNKDAVNVLGGMLADTKQPFFLRSACAWCLGRVAGPEAQAHLKAAFADIDLNVREDALEAVVSIGSSAYPTLRDGLFDKNSEIAAGCAEAIRQAGRSGRPLILELAKELHQKPTDWLVWLLGQLPSDELTAAIAEIQKDVDPRLHYAITLLWAFSRSWIARGFELNPNAHRETQDVS